MTSTHRFWESVDKRGPGGCWLWTGHRSKRGYGKFWAGRSLLAHRVSAALDYRNPVGQEVCHECDNPPCVNPAHLWVGTHSDNMRDAVAKGRHKSGLRGRDFSGERHGGAKLTAAQALEIYRRGATEWAADLAAEYGVASRAVRRILNGKQWASVTGGKPVKREARVRSRRHAQAQGASGVSLAEVPD